MATQIRFTLPILVILFIGLLGTPQAVYAINISSCTEIWVSGTYDLVADINNTQSFECIAIKASNVTLNGHNHVIDGQNISGSTGIAVYTDYPVQTSEAVVAIGPYALTNININNVQVKEFESGIFLYDVGSSTIKGCNSSYNTRAGIQVLKSNGNLIENCRLWYNSEIGLVLRQSSEENTIKDNSIRHHVKGIQCGGYETTANNNSIISNDVRSNTLGMGIEKCGGLYISENQMFSNEYGIFMSNASDNTVTRNVVEHGSSEQSDRFCIRLTDSSNNLIYDNFFSCTDENVEINAEGFFPNYWNITKVQDTNIVGGPYRCGNYWGDYYGLGNGISVSCSSDQDLDYLCDDPYQIDSNNVDSCPLTEPESIVYPGLIHADGFE